MIAWVLWVVGGLSCLLIAYEDIRSRTVSVVWLVAFGLAGLGFQLAYSQPLWDIAWNLVLLGFIIGIILLFYRLKGQKVMDRALGWGDVVMLIGLAMWFDTAGFLGFYVVSTLLISFIFLTLRAFKRIPKDYPIPLAGFMAIMWLIYFPLNRFLFPNFLVL